MAHGTLSLLKGSLKSRVLDIEILDATPRCPTEAARDRLEACFGGSDEELLFLGEQLFYRPQTLEGGPTVPEESF